eukprot:Amastigsp_a676229_50.p4 type:complete len:114 gc:universal Amastigsp_a676229_50:478-819(+)
MLVRPHFAGGATAGLHLIDHERRVERLAHALESLEERRRRGVVTALALNRFDDDCGDGRALLPRLVHDCLDGGDAALLLRGVLGGVRVQRVAQRRERRHGPVERGDVELVDGL